VLLGCAIYKCECEFVNLIIVVCLLGHLLYQVPKVQKIVVNCGIGDAAQNDKGLEAAVKDIALITGQKPIKTRARASIATFKIREDQPLGIAVTLRGDVSYISLD